MQISQYLKAYPYKEIIDHHLLLFSTKNSSKILIHEDTFKQLKKGLLSSKEKKIITELSMIVPDQAEEQSAVFNLFDTLNQKDTSLNITVVLNLDCNFDCTYCFEGDLKGKHYMSEKTADRLIEFIKKRFTPEKNKLLLSFFGGEPLLSLGLIKYISRAMKLFMEERDATYEFSLVTNGSLLTRRVVGELTELGLNGVSVTLDGTEENHNKTRPYKSGAGSFSTIIQNLQQVYDLIDISINGNFQKDNYSNYFLLPDYLKFVGLTPDKIASVKFSPVIDPNDNAPPASCYSRQCVLANEPWLIKADLLLREEILKYGYYTPKPTVMTCMVEMVNSLVVNYDGTIYKCPGFIGKEGYETGTLQSSSLNVSAYKCTWNNEGCKACEYLPLCYGGCRYMTYIQKGMIDGPDCRKKYFDTSLETIIKQDIRYRQ